MGGSRKAKVILALVALLALIGVLSLWLRSGGGAPVVPEDRMAEPGQPKLRPVKPRWTFNAGANIEFPPVSDGRRVFVGAENDRLNALEAATGEPLWTYQPVGRLWASSLTLAKGVLLVGSEGGVLSALDPGNGHVLWRRQLTGEVRFSPAVHDDILYVATTFVGGGMNNDRKGRARAYALRAADGAVIWERATDNYLLRTPVLHNDTLYAGGSFLDPRPVDEGGHTRIYALDAATGSVKWTRESEDGLIKNMHADGKTLVYLAYRDLVHGLDAATGTPRWSYNTENWVHGFAAAGDRVYFSSANGFVHTLDVPSGNLVWKSELYGVFNYIIGAPALRDGVLYFHTTFREMHALDARTGKVLWRARDGVDTHGAVATDGERLYLGSIDGNLYAFDIPRRARPR